MHTLDWIVLFGTLGFIAVYGSYKYRKSHSLEDYLASNRNTPWWAIGLSIMATQASAITFLSTPGLGYSSGLRFVQFYFGLPLALLIVGLWFAPMFHRKKVFTAYEYLEEKFDLKTRLLAAILFLIQRGLAAGITIYAPSIVLSAVLGWPLWINILIIGAIVVVYTVIGGNNAVTVTHKQQMAVIFLGMVVAFGFIVYQLQPFASFSESLNMGRITGRLVSVDTTFKLNERYNLWSGLLGGTFLMLSYFGTDQSQVQRFLSGKSLKEIRLGLLFNAVLKIPMQYFILLLGVLLFAFYQYYKPPVYFDHSAVVHLEQNDSKWLDSIKRIEENLFNQKKAVLLKPRNDPGRLEEFNRLSKNYDNLSNEIQIRTVSTGFKARVKQSDYVFITFILDYLPAGLIGLLLAMIFSAAMSSTSSELTALSTTTAVDLYLRFRPEKGAIGAVIFTKWATFAWGMVAIGFALIASMLENLVEAVNILGSLFYGTILGIFICSFFLKKSKSNSVFIAAIFAQSIVFLLFFFEEHVADLLGSSPAFLWYNLFACVLVVLLSVLLPKSR
jgi:Na+/proline symporter